MKKLSFLPLFFVLLAIGFAAAVWLRLRSFESDAGSPVVAAELADASAQPVVEEGVAPIRSDGGPDIVTDADAAVTRDGRAASLREQRYRELLASRPPTSEPAPAPEASPAAGQPQARPAAPKPPPSLFQRIVKPVAEALGVNRPAPPAAQPASRGSGQQTTVADDRHSPEQVDRDADSDVAAPRLVAVEFVPPQVHDGEQTLLTVVVTDDLSGVRSVSGVIANPTGGGQQAFSAQREGDGSRFTARVLVPRDAAEGVWSIRYMTLTDNASNSVNLSAAQAALPPSASFRVVSAGSDSAGPVLRAVWLDQSAMSAGEKNHVFVQVDDDRSGVGLVSGVFVSPSKQARIGFGCRAAEGNTWQCPVTPPACVDCGSWQLEQIQMHDKANNMATARADNPLVAPVRLQLMGRDCDSTPPVITSLSLSPPVVSNAQNSIVTVTAIATDDQCGVASLSGNVLPPPGTASKGIYFSFKPAGDGQTFTGDIAVPAHAASGTWTLNWIMALDKGHNQKSYPASDPVVSRVSFRVE